VRIELDYMLVLYRILSEGLSVQVTIDFVLTHSGMFFAKGFFNLSFDELELNNSSRALP
jgi:hypothetical protein